MSTSSLILLGGLLALVAMKSKGVSSNLVDETTDALNRWQKKMGHPRDWFKTQKQTKPEQWIRGVHYEGSRGGVLTRLVSPITTMLGFDKKSPPTPKQKAGFIDQSSPKKDPDTELFKPMRQIYQYGHELATDMERVKALQGGPRRERPGLINFGQHVKSLIQEGKHLE